MKISKCYVSSRYSWFSGQSWFKWRGAKKIKGTDLISLRTHKIHTPLPAFHTLKLWHAVFANVCYSERQDQSRVGEFGTASLSLLEKQSICKLAQNRTLKKWQHTYTKWHDRAHALRLECIANGIFVVVQSLSRVWLFVTPWTAAYQASLSFTISQSLLKFRSTESVMPSNQLILCRPLLLLPSIFPRVIFSSESALCIRWPKYWSFSFSLSNEYSALISFRIDWFDLLEVQGTQLSRVFSSTTVWKHQFFGAKPSLWSNFHTCMTTGKIIALTIRTFVNKVMSLLFSMLPRFVIAFIPRSKHFDFKANIWDSDIVTFFFFISVSEIIKVLRGGR